MTRATIRALLPCLVAVVVVGVVTGSGVAQDTEEREATTQGRWAIARGQQDMASRFLGPGTGLTEEQRLEIERLNSVAYLGATEPAQETSGVTVYDVDRAFEGLNLYTSGHSPVACLMNMDGVVVHEWRCDFVAAWPESAHLANRDGAGYWRRAHLMDNGDLLAVYEGLGLVKLDRDSRVLWTHFGREHHDLEVLPDGRILVLTREAKIVPWVNSRHAVLEDFVTLLDPDGHEISSVSVLEAFGESEWRHLLLDGRRRGDIMHTNTVEMLDGRVSESVPAFAAGNVLLCVRQLDAVVVLDLDEGDLEWGEFSPWKRQHQATVLESGNIMLFDNSGNGGFSRILEFDPRTLEIAWSYAGQDPADFYSKTCGSNQRLPNGNTLITESDYGRAFEVTHDGSVVWEFINPAQVGESPRLIATLFELLRVPPDFPTRWIDQE
jgi:hypothetical protein